MISAPHVALLDQPSKADVDEAVRQLGQDAAQLKDSLARLLGAEGGEEQLRAGWPELSGQVRGMARRCRQFLGSLDLARVSSGVPMASQLV